MKKPLGLKFEEELIRRLDEARGSESRTAWIERAVEDSLVVRAVSGGVEKRVVSADVAIHRQPRPAKPLRLAVASDVLTSAQAKAGLRPVDWRARAGGES